MLFVVERTRMRKIALMIRGVTPSQLSKGSASYLRIEAQDGQVTLSGLDLEAAIPATVHEAGVLFIRFQAFARILATFKDDKFMTFQANADGFMFGDVRLALGADNLLLYPDPKKAPQQHPADQQEVEQIREAAINAAEERVSKAQEELEAARAELRQSKGDKRSTREVLRDHASTAKPRTKKKRKKA